ncbi:MAG: HAD family phosphatase [Victivallales bacterium]|nr:HAD family phosphatase [Victivallales bacterium]
MEKSCYDKACLFDMDGVLVDTEPIWAEAIQFALARRGVNLSFQEVSQLENGRAWPEIFQDIARQWPNAYATRQEMEAITVPFYQCAVASRDVSIPASVELLRRLAEDGYPVVIVSGSARHRIQEVMGMLGISTLVKAIVSHEDCPHGKPAPDSYLLAAEKLHCPPSRCVVFEDSTAGVQAAKAAGMTCVALCRPQSLPQDLSQADLIVESLANVNLNKLFHS